MPRFVRSPSRPRVATRTTALASVRDERTNLVNPKERIHGATRVCDAREVVAERRNRRGSVRFFKNTAGAQLAEAQHRDFVACESEGTRIPSLGACGPASCYIRSDD